MSFDGVVTHAMAYELNNFLATGRILKIYQPTGTELVFTIRSKGQNFSVLLSSHPSYARFHITEDTYNNPQEPPMFCMLLRKHLIGGFIEKVEQVEMERIVKFYIRGKNEIGDETTKILVIEVMGKHSNILLIDESRNMILESIKHITPSINRHRTIMPGKEYVLPPDQGKVNPLLIDQETFVQKLDFNSGKLDRQIVQNFLGFSPLIAKEITFQAKLSSGEKFKQAFTNIQSKILKNDYQPTIFHAEKEHFYVLPLDSVEGEQETYSTISEMLDSYYSGKAERDRVKQQAGDLSRFLKNERDKNERKIKKHYQTLEKAQKKDEYQRFGELLTAHMHLVKLGDKKVTVVDYYDPEQAELTISLNPNKTPSQNAQNYFHTYQKLKKSEAVVQEEIKKAEAEINYFDQLIQQIESAREQDIEEIREELREEGYLKAKSLKGKKKNKHTPSPEKYLSSEGVQILVGRNNKQNEHLTTRIANRDDVWLHTKDIPGSHVVIRDSNPSEHTLLEAAQIAAFYSKSKNSSSVPVDYTQVRHVKKPNGAKPGFVIYENQKTLFVTPDEVVVNKLKES